MDRFEEYLAKSEKYGEKFWWCKPRLLTGPRTFLKIFKESQYVTVDVLMEHLCKLCLCFNAEFSKITIEMKLAPRYSSNLLPFYTLTASKTFKEAALIYQAHKKELKNREITAGSIISICDRLRNTKINIRGHTHTWISCIDSVVTGGTCCYPLSFTIEQTENDALASKVFNFFPAFIGGCS